MKEFRISYSHYSQKWDDITTQISSSLNMEYNILSDKIAHNVSVPYLPFEKDYKWHRENKILQCYSKFKLFDNESNSWIDIVVIFDGLEVSIPDTYIFRKWLSTEIVFKNYPDLKKFITNS